MLDCFCAEQYNSLGTDLYYTKFNSTENPDLPEKYICADWLSEQGSDFIAGLFVSILITLVNMLFKKVVFPLVKMLSLHTVSSENRYMMITTFLLTLFDSAILIVFLNWNFSDSEFEFLRENLTSGNQVDWGTEWYEKVGPIILQTMLMQAFSPFIEFFTAYATKRLLIWVDKGFYMPWGEKVTTSKKNTVEGYFELYGGPEYEF